MNQDQLAVEKVLQVQKMDVLNWLFLQQYKSREVDKTQGSNSFVSLCNLNIGIDVVSRNWLNLLCRLVQSQKRQFLILFKGYKKKCWKSSLCFLSHMLFVQNLSLPLFLWDPNLYTTVAWLHFLDHKQTSHVNLTPPHETKKNPTTPKAPQVGELTNGYWCPVNLAVF